MKLKMKTTATLLIAIFMISIFAVIVPAMTKPQAFTVPIKQAQFQWRAWAPFTDWSYQYQNDDTTIDGVLTGNVLHSSYTYSPAVSDLEGEQTIYVFDKKSELWIEREGTVKYKYQPYYGDYYIVNYWRGYLNFDGTPSANSFVHGVAYQWVYIDAPQEAEAAVKASGSAGLPYAQWDPVMEMWLTGYSVYLWDSGDQSYTLSFQFVEPVPANNYNPLTK